jgi:hypothetical protein
VKLLEKGSQLRDGEWFQQHLLEHLAVRPTKEFGQGSAIAQ